MLEIFALIYLWIKMGDKLRDKGWTKTFWMQLLVIVTWFFSMLAGMFAYGIFLGLTQGAAAAQNLGFGTYVAAVLSAVIGTGILFFIVSRLPVKPFERALPEAATD